jgi:hypothetical protein
LLGAALGAGLGARHALEPDHLAAISVLAAERPGTRRGALLGAAWGAGHSLTLMACGLGAAVVAGGTSRLQIPSDFFEAVVAVMLVALGARAVLRAARAPAADVEHAHAVGHSPRRPGALRPLLVGMVHGLAGSGALIALVTLRLSGAGARLAFISAFGAGSIVGMSVISGLAGWPLERAARHPAAARWLLGTTGAASALLGLAWGLSAHLRGGP